MTNKGEWSKYEKEKAMIDIGWARSDGWSGEPDAPDVDWWPPLLIANSPAFSDKMIASFNEAWEITLLIIQELK